MAGGLVDTNQTGSNDETVTQLADGQAEDGTKQKVAADVAGNNSAFTSTVIRGRDGTHECDVILEGGVRRLQTTAQATITGGLFGRTVFPSTIMTIDTAPTSGDQLRFQIADDSIDVTTTFATEGLNDAARRVRDDLNTDSNFDALYTARVPGDSNQICIEANEIFTLRTDSGDVVMTTPTATTLAATLLFDTINERNIDLAIFPSNDDCTKGTINVQGEVGSLITGRPPEFFFLETSGNASSMRVNGSVTPVEFRLTNNSNWDTTRDFTVTQVRVMAGAQGINYGSGEFLKISTLTNGVDFMIRSGGAERYTVNIKEAEDFIEFMSVGSASRAQRETGTGNDVALYTFDVPFRVRRAGTFTPDPDDDVIVTINDNLTSGQISRFRMSIVGFYED